MFTFRDRISLKGIRFDRGRGDRRVTKRRRRVVLLTISAVTFGGLVVPGWAADSSSPASVLRINAGGGMVTDSVGRTWQADRYFTGGTAHAVTASIAGTKDQDLFRSERWGAAGYDIPVTNGSYLLQLLFAEINPSSGRRVMTVTANGKTMLSNYEIAAKVGTYRSTVERAAVTVSDGWLRIRMTASSNSTSIAGIELLGSSTGSTNTTRPPTTTVKPTVTTVKAPTTITTNPISAMTPSMSGWQLVSSDRFDGSSIDSKKWASYNGPGNEGVGWRSPDHVRVSGGALHLVGSGTTAGGVSMKVNQTYGRWVIRAKQDKGNGFGPALLLWPDSGRWPVDGEIDIAEIPKGDRTKSYFTVHWGSNNSTKGFSTVADFSQWHTWTTEWTRDHITTWMDGKLVGTITDPASIPDGSMHLAIQNDVGKAGHWITGRDASTPSEVSLHVDYVEVYKKM